MLHFVFKVNKTVKYKEETHNYKARKERQETITYKNETKQSMKPEKNRQQRYKKDLKKEKNIIRMLQTTQRFKKWPKQKTTTMTTKSKSKTPKRIQKMTIEPIKGTKTGKNLCKHQLYITENEPTMKQEINRSTYYK